MDISHHFYKIRSKCEIFSPTFTREKVIVQVTKVEVPPLREVGHITQWRALKFRLVYRILFFLVSGGKYVCH